LPINLMGSWFSFASINADDVRILDTDAGDPPNVENTAEGAAALIQQHAGETLVITGAGISSHQLPTFRSNNNSGLWEAFKPACDRWTFYDNPHDSWKLIATLRDMQLRGNLTPSLAHHVIHHLLCRTFVSHVITQNIDGLHGFASDVNKVIELHGGVRDYGVCERCHRRTPVDCVELLRLKNCPLCSRCASPLKPPVTLFGDVIDPGKRAAARVALQRASLVILIGTHLTVDPVLSMVSRAKENGAVIVEINLTPTSGSRFVDVSLRGKADDAMKAIATVLMPDVDWEGLRLEEWERAELPD
jgi:NAD-dependent deacetylase